MKKVLFLILFIPFFVFADVAAPNIKPYVGVINNKNGASLYGFDLEKNEYIASNQKIEYGTKVYVYDQFDEYAIIENYEDYILIKDVTPINETYEEYINEINKNNGIVPIVENKEKEVKNNNNILYICLIGATILLFGSLIIIHTRNKK